MSRRPDTVPTARTKRTLRPFYEAGRAVVSAALGVVPAAVTVDPKGRQIGIGGGRLDAAAALSLRDRLVVSHAANLVLQRACPFADDMPEAPGSDAALVAGVHARGRELVEQPWPLIEHVARRLADEQTLSGEALAAILTQRR